MALELTSAAFAADGPIPVRYTCEGEDVSPPLSWSGVPAGSQSLVLIIEDPDAPDPAAPRMTWIHWVLYNLSPQLTGLDEAAGGPGGSSGGLDGLNDWQRTGYGGPCPPVGRHRYYHRLYALDRTLPDLGKPTRQVLEQAMSGHVLEMATLMGTYQKQH